MLNNDWRARDRAEDSFNRDFAELIGQQQMLTNKAQAKAVNSIAAKLRALQKRYHNHRFVFEDCYGSTTITITHRKTATQRTLRIEDTNNHYLSRFGDLSIFLAEIFHTAECFAEHFRVNVGVVVVMNF